MTKLQITVILSAVVLFFVLYFGCDTKPQKQQAIEKSRALAAESTDIDAQLRTAKEGLSPSSASSVLFLEQQLEITQQDSARAEVLKQLSSTWFSAERPDIAGYYAEQVAELLNTEESWSIAGTTYGICANRSSDAAIKSFCVGRAIQAFENAISLNPSETQHKVNLALMYADAPPADNPMKGIQLLLELNKQNPDDVPVLLALGRLAVRTGQYDRAAERLEHVLTVDPQNRVANCTLVEVYTNLNNTARATQQADKCQALGG